MKIQPESVSLELIKLLRDKEEYVVHSCFESGFNIKVNGFLSFVGNKKNTKLPYGILLKEQPIPSLLQLVDEKKVSFIWDEEKKQLISKEINIDFKGCKYFSSFLKKKPYRLPNIYFDLLKDNIDMNLKTGFGLSFKQLIYEKNIKIDRLYLSFKSKERESIRSSLLKWVGYGLGLTPSGDDFLVGMLFANNICPILGQEFLEELKIIVKEEKYTTDTSTHYYLSSFQNCYNDALLQMYQALLAFDKKAVKQSVNKILQFGHTSGCDIMAGILGGLFYGLESYRLD